MAHRRLYISDAKMQILHPNQILRRRRRQLNLDIPSAAIAKGNQLANLANLISGSPVLGGGDSPSWTKTVLTSSYNMSTINNHSSVSLLRLRITARLPLISPDLQEGHADGRLTTSVYRTLTHTFYHLAEFTPSSNSKA